MGSIIEQCCSPGSKTPCVEVWRSSSPIRDLANVATSQIGSGGRPLRRRRPKNNFWAVCDIERETFTQGAVGQAESIALFKTPHLIVKFGDTGTFMFVSVMLYEEWSSFNVKSLDPGRAKDAEGRVV
ncbi:hypothetical protein O0I10_005206 [Lichtheimia ornata]|uniref:Uncharacterized protein n=1 Tax=Lichtheimia ornata TaxID=688661 RepID=A0AAD7Y1T2_9FUNG|nr:uncharacterized protein O0I10_005206 [Lichtheimia ornata]KAJ8659167.1 hypothetical protein O0I10_005206 [Lichtheimia ornata]